MTRNEFDSVIRQFASDSGIDVKPSGDAIYELHLTGDESPRRNFIKVETEGSGVIAIQFSSIVGVVKDSGALRVLLTKNCGGVMGTEFYFAVREVGGVLYAMLETKQVLDPGAGTDWAMGLLLDLWMCPLSTNEWNFPTGVQNFLW
jgi:hypothetical protein